MSAALNFDFSLLEAQSHAHLAFQPGNTVCIPWGRGCGKSWFVRTTAYLLIAEWDGVVRPLAKLPGVRIVVLMPTLEQARKVHTDLLLAELDGDWAFLGAKVNKTSWRVTFPGGSWIQFVTAERAQFIRGIRCDVVYVDEADDISPELVDSVVTPWFSEPHSLKQMMLAGTPRRGRKGLLYRAYKEWPAVDETCFGFHATAFDAPGIVDRAYLDKVKLRTVEEIFKREWLCDFDAAEGLVYPMFSERFHVREPPLDVVWDEILFGADHGWEDPGVILLIGILGKGRDAQAWVLDELYEQHREPDWWLAQVGERVGWYPDAKWYPDHKPEVTAGWKRIGARIQDVDKSAGTIEGGVAVVQQWLHVREKPGQSVDGEPVAESYARLYVHPRCENLINEFGLYRRRRDPRNTEVVLDDIEDNNNHAMDALRYALVNRFEYGGSRKRDANMEDRNR